MNDSMKIESKIWFAFDRMRRAKLIVGFRYEKEQQERNSQLFSEGLRRTRQMALQLTERTATAAESIGKHS